MIYCHFRAKKRPTMTLVEFSDSVTSIFTIWSLGKKGVSQAKPLFFLLGIFMALWDTLRIRKKFSGIYFKIFFLS